MPPRRSKDPWDAAEAVFKPAAPPRPAPPTPDARVPGARESVTLRVEADVLAFFQEDGPGWQDRMVEALRKAAGL